MATLDKGYLPPPQMQAALQASSVLKPTHNTLLSPPGGQGPKFLSPPRHSAPAPPLPNTYIAPCPRGSRSSFNTILLPR